MYKLLDFKATDVNGDRCFHVITPSSNIIKLASEASWAPKIAEKIKEITPAEGKIYVVITALGAGEYYGCNINGDYFPEDVLKETCHTFVTKGSPFMHHSNTATSKVYGKILVADYNDHMHRVEIITEYDTAKLPKKYVDKLNNGDIVHTSMGCRVPYDICSICNHIAKSPKEYCKCLKSSPGLGKNLPNGKKAFAINTKPEFFDDSIVSIPADRTARVMFKIAEASDDGTVSSAENAARAIEIAGTPVTEINTDDNSDTVEDIDDIDDIIKPMNPAIKQLTSLLGGELPNETLDRLGLMGEPFGLIKSLIHKKVFLSPRETQRIVIVSLGKKKLADELDKRKVLLTNSNDAPDNTISTMIPRAVRNSLLENMIDSMIPFRKINPVMKRRLVVRILISPESGELEKTANLVNYVPESDSYKVLDGSKESTMPAFADIAATAKETIGGVLALGLILGTVHPELGASVIEHLPLAAAGVGTAITLGKAMDKEDSYTPQAMHFESNRDMPGLKDAINDLLVKSGSAGTKPYILKESLSLLGTTAKLANARKKTINYIKGIEKMHNKKFATIYKTHKDTILTALEHIIFT